MHRLVETVRRWPKWLIHRSPLSEECFRNPAYCPVITANTHWRVAEKAGFTTRAQFVRSSLKFGVFGLTATAAILAGVYKNRFSHEERITATAEVLDEFDELRGGLTTAMIGSFFVFGFKFGRPLTTGLLRQCTLRRDNLKGAMVSWLAEPNLYRLIVWCSLLTPLLQPGYFHFNTENAIASGSLGAVFGSVMSGITLARYNTPLGLVGPIGMLAGLAGFGIFRKLGLQTEDQVAMENNRNVLIGNQISSIPYLTLALSYFIFAGSMFTITLYASYGSAVAGGLTGGYMASKIDQHRAAFYANGDKLIQLIS